jgi:uncharacterized protein DUF3606
MADDKSKQAADRTKISGSEAYEVKYFANKHKISLDQARQLIGEVGNDRQKLDAAAARLKGR